MNGASRGIDSVRGDDAARRASRDRAPRDGRAHVVGDRSRPLDERTIPQVLADTVARHGAREAAVFAAQEIRWTWDEFAAEVDALALGLHALGLARGERVGVWAPNRAEWLLAQFATARLGLVLVNVNPAYRLGELEYALSKVGCRAVLVSRAFKTSDYLGMIRTLAPELDAAAPGELRAARLPDLRHVILMDEGEPSDEPGIWSFSALMREADGAGGAERARLDAVTAGLDRHDAVNIQFTSGTTGLPKGATLTHRNIVNNARFVTDAMELTEHDRLCIPVPFYHCFGMVMGTLGCVTKGAAMVVPGEGFDPRATLEAVSGERCTALYGVPTMFQAMLDEPDFASFDLSHLRTGIMAGAPCPVKTMRRVEGDMNMEQVTIAYGMTETSPVSFQSNVDDPLERRVSTVGRVHPHVEVRIVDADGASVAPGEQGELCTRGYSVMQGYWDEPERTAEAIRDGWMMTGDLAVIDADGYANITGRVKDMIVRGGENVYPREVEEYLYRLPGVAQVQVFGVPDERYGEAVASWIVREASDAGMALDEGAVRAFCGEQIAHFKVPAHIRFVDEIPMTVTGKPRKFVMREAMAEELGLEEAETA